MSLFYPHERIAAQPGNHAKHMGAYHPVAPQPMTMPLSIVEMTADGISVTEAVPLVAADGAPYPATAPGEWNQIHAYGRP